MEFVDSVPAQGSRPELRVRRQSERRWRKNRQAVDEIEIIAWDGEGMGREEHKYVLLANSLGSKLRASDDGETWGGGPLGRLDTEAILDLVWKTGLANPSAVHVMYGATYDWNNWLWRADKPTAEWLHQGRPVKLGTYTAKFNGLWFEVTRNRRTIMVWDVWKFWAQGFAPALEDALPDFHGLPIIRKFKDLRGGFTQEMMPEVEQYNDLELEALVLLVRKLFQDLADAKIRRPGYLTGAGAIAGSILGQLGVSEHNEQPPAAVMDALLRAFSAGRIEALKIGTHIGPFWTNDVRSAYPYAMKDLPSMKDGEWAWREGPDVAEDWDDRMSVWHVEWDYTVDRPPTRRFYPLFFREPSGMVHYPIAGEGWYMWPEIVTALALGWPIKVHGGWVLKQADPSIYPFRKLPGLFKHRQWLKDNGFPGAQRVLKYGLAAVYGKTCQARGSTPDKPPRFQNFGWSAWTTSHCRATMLEAMMQDPDSVVYVMTDSVATTKQLDIKVGHELGEWEVEEYERAMVVQAGVGSLWKDGERIIDKYRGFDRGSIDPNKIIEQWKLNAESKKRDPITTWSPRPVTLGTALASDEWFLLWNSWQDTKRDLDVYGGDGKRTLQREVYKIKPWAELIDLEPFGTLGLRELRQLEMEQSAPYEPRWADAAVGPEEMIGSLAPVPDRAVDDELVAGALA
jgi:hypothetical protein